MQLSQGSIWYLERAGLVATRRGPRPRIALAYDPVFSYPMAPPLPQPEQRRPAQGSPPPDRGLSDVWPNGVAGTTQQ